MEEEQKQADLVMNKKMTKLEKALIREYSLPLKTIRAEQWLKEKGIYKCQ